MSGQAAHRIEVVTGDITRLSVTSIVNAANTQLLAGSGVCGAIFRAAGSGLAEECAEKASCPTGEARLTSGYRLPARWIIHAVGPVWQGGGAGEAKKLRSAYLNALAIAAEERMESIAFPAISTGIYGYPAGKAANVAVKACLDHCVNDAYPRRILLVGFDKAQAEVLERALSRVSG